VRSDRHDPEAAMGHPVVIGARIGAGLGAVLTVAFALIAGAVGGESLMQWRPSSIERLIDGVAAGAAFGGVAAALRCRHGP